MDQDVCSPAADSSNSVFVYGVLAVAGVLTAPQAGSLSLWPVSPPRHKPLVASQFSL